MSKSIIIRAAKFYYEDNMSQQEIANKLGLSRMAVSRMLQKAREEKIVEIKIHYEGSYIDLEDAVKEKYGVKEVLLSPYGNSEELKNTLAEAAAGLLLRVVKNKDTVAVGWGSTISYIPQHITKAPRTNAIFVPLLGGYGQAQLHFHANQIAAGLAEAFKGSAYYLHAPAMLDSLAMKGVFLQNDEIRRTLELGARADIAVIGIGSPFGTESTLFDSGYFKDADIEELRDAGAECDIVSCVYLDAAGRACGQDISARVLGVTGEGLQKIPLVVGVAGGEAKRRAIELALRSGYIDVLVTDIETGRYLAEQN